MIGFALYGIDEDDFEYWIYRMMIDRKHQGKGYGKEAIKLVIEDIKVNIDDRHQTLTLSYEPTPIYMLNACMKKWGLKK